MMEDESGRIALGGKIDALIGKLVTGIVLAVKGTMDGQGTLQVGSSPQLHQATA